MQPLPPVRLAISTLVFSFLVVLPATPAHAQEKPVVGLIPKAQKPIEIRRQTGRLGRGLRHAGPRRPSRLRQPGRAVPLPLGRREPLHRPAMPRPEAGPRRHGRPTLERRCRRVLPGHPAGRQTRCQGSSVPAPCTCSRRRSPKTEIKPRITVRDLPAFKDFKLQGAEVAAEKTPWGWTAEFKLPWANFPDFKPKAGEIIGIECELCSSDGGRGWIAPSSTPALPPLARRLLSGGCNWWTRSSRKL